MGEIPKYIMEIFAFGSIIVVVLYLLITAQGFQEILPLVGLFTFGAYRMMPSLQKIFVSITQMRFSFVTLDTLYEDMQNINTESYKKEYEKVKPIRLKDYLKLENILFHYPGDDLPVIKGLSLKIKTNTSVAFVGETGAGKTTIANIILGLLRPNEGKMIVDGLEINDENIFNWQRNLGYIPQDIYLQDDTVIRNIAFGVQDRTIDMDQVKYSAKIANIHGFIVKELPNGYNTKIGERGVRLSGGQKQRIGIARALYHDPGVLVLDEATSALDGATEKAVFEAIKNIAETKTLIIIAHRLTTVKNCDVVFILDRGEILGEGKYNKLIESNKKFRNIAREGNYL
jgi:ATP-binding cassette, subfamily B, bacterial PglK